MKPVEEMTRQEKCAYHLPHIDFKNNDIIHSCLTGSTLGGGHRPIEGDECETCDRYKSKFIEYPITVNGIKTEPFDYSYHLSGEVGSLCKIRPCGKEYEDKTYLGLYLGELPWFISSSYKEETGILTTKAASNPAILVFDLKKIIFGCESWWQIIKDKSELSDITDEDIDNVWYMQLLKAMKNNE